MLQSRTQSYTVEVYIFHASRWSTGGKHRTDGTNAINREFTLFNRVHQSRAGCSSEALDPGEKWKCNNSRQVTGINTIPRNSVFRGTLHTYRGWELRSGFRSSTGKFEGAAAFRGVPDLLTGKSVRATLPEIRRNFRSQGLLRNGRGLLSEFN